eukprot:scaffold825_cov249-Pinguiococcus_pyrenoidosus.AAC.16
MGYVEDVDRLLYGPDALKLKQLRFNFSYIRRDRDGRGGLAVIGQSEGAIQFAASVSDVAHGDVHTTESVGHRIVLHDQRAEIEWRASEAQLVRRQQLHRVEPRRYHDARQRKGVFELRVNERHKVARAENSEGFIGRCHAEKNRLRRHQGTVGRAEEQTKTICAVPEGIPVWPRKVHELFHCLRQLVARSKERDATAKLACPERRSRRRCADAAASPSCSTSCQAKRSAPRTHTGVVKHTIAGHKGEVAMGLLREVRAHCGEGAQGLRPPETRVGGRQLLARVKAEDPVLAKLSICCAPRHRRRFHASGRDDIHPARADGQATNLPQGLTVESTD